MEINEFDNGVFRNIYMSLDKLLVDIDELMQKNRPLLNGEKYISENELANKLKVTVRTLKEHRLKGLLPYYKIVGKIFYRESDIEKILSDNKTHAYK